MLKVSAAEGIVIVLYKSIGGKHEGPGIIFFSKSTVIRYKLLSSIRLVTHWGDI